MIDYDKVAIKASETLIKYEVTATPVSPLHILKKMYNVIVVSFADLGESSGMSRKEIMPMFGKNMDAVSSYHPEGNKPMYVVAYNSLLPFAVIQRALARELGHIVLKHSGSSEENTAEAICFAQHLLCPRPLIHTIKATNLRLTVDLLANLTGIFDQMLINMRRTPATNVPAGLNRFVRNQFMPFILNYIEYYQYAMPKDGSAMADLGTFMDGYIE